MVPRLCLAVRRRLAAGASSPANPGRPGSGRPLAAIGFNIGAPIAVYYLLHGLGVANLLALGAGAVHTALSWTGHTILPVRALKQRELRQLSSGPARLVKPGISGRAGTGAPPLVPPQAGARYRRPAAAASLKA